MRPGERRRALVLGYRAPGRDAGSARIADLLGLLAADGWRPAFATAEPLADPREARELRQSGVPVYDGTTADLETLLAEGGFRIAICASWQIGELYLASIRRLSPETAVLIDAPSLQLVRGARASLCPARGSGRAARLGAEYGSELTGELNVYASSDAVLTASAPDAELLNTLLGDDRLACWVPDAGEVRSRTIPFAARKGIVLPAIPDDPAYADAAAFLRSAIEPRLGRELLDRHPVSVTDGLPSVLERALLTVVPLRSDPLSSRAQIQSLLAGTPVVTTSAGQRGLDVTAGAGLLVADDEASIADSVERLATDKMLWLRLARRGRARVRRFHTREAVRSRLLEALALAQDRQSRHPQPVEGDRARFELRLRRRRARELVPTIREVVRATVPADSHIAVLSEGAEELLPARRRDGDALSSSYGRPTRPQPVPPTAARRSPCSSTRFATERRSPARPQHGVHLARRLPRVRRLPARPLLGTRRGKLQRRRPPAGRGPGGPGLRSGWSPSTCRSSTRSPRTTSGGARASPSGRNVAKAEPLFPGHYQPHVPADLGFYDLRLAETRQRAGGAGARGTASTAFCYYHYWFDGQAAARAAVRRGAGVGRARLPVLPLLGERALVAALGRTRRRRAPAADLQPRGRRRAHPLAAAGAAPTRGRSRSTASRCSSSTRRSDLPDPGADGRHLAARRPHGRAPRPLSDDGRDRLGRGLGRDRGRASTPRSSSSRSSRLLQTVPRLDVGRPETHAGLRLRAGVAGARRARSPSRYRRYETVCPGWDNTPRAGRERRGAAQLDARGVRASGCAQAVERAAQREPPEQRLVFLNAWNEWAEGATSSPISATAAAYLEATRRALESPPRSRRRTPVGAAPADDRRRRARRGACERAASARLLAFYLPQFHPIPENDEWWGTGFTEWTNVARGATALPRALPAAPARRSRLLRPARPGGPRARRPSSRAKHGIEAFCYWHYWFSGRRLLERPFEEVLAIGQPDFPFCLAWANETWSRRWLGEPADVLIEQRYSPQDDLEHARWLLEAFADPRYMRVFGRPLFLVYRPTRSPDPAAHGRDHRTETCVNAGLPEPFLLGMNVAMRRADFRDLGFDGTIEFEPQLGGSSAIRLADGLKRSRLRARRAQAMRSSVARASPSIRRSSSRWDNTPRRGDADRLHATPTPASFEQGLREPSTSVAAAALSRTGSFS